MEHTQLAQPAHCLMLLDWSASGPSANSMMDCLAEAMAGRVKLGETLWLKLAPHFDWGATKLKWELCFYWTMDLRMVRRYLELNWEFSEDVVQILIVVAWDNSFYVVEALPALSSFVPHLADQSPSKPGLVMIHSRFVSFCTKFTLDATSSIWISISNAKCFNAPKALSLSQSSNGQTKSRNKNNRQSPM